MRLDPLPAFDDNYIWLLQRAGQVVVVDPGEAGPVLAAAAAGPRPDVILLTHHHADHIGGVGALLERWPDLEVVAPVDERIPHATRRVDDGDVVEAAGLAFRVLAIPGHTRSHIAFHAPDDGGVLFSGDTLFSLGCGRLFEGTPAGMHRSLSRLAALPGTTRVCCGHEYTLANAAFARAVEPGNEALARRTEEVHAMRNADRPTLPSLLSDELACNPFLRCGQPQVAAAAARHAGTGQGGPVETFAALRAWKDGFRA
ncbi:hydroxyacylglutathione hydrolase [Novilysobacter defluvii]|uniref:Hydroxyacylglutathione hydrolase n=1 Tax=Lysobacter defluvii IMMIB APB-9 = DSM 18482 TaxID=1385515 RepID=A0A0A0M5Y5_9GAMM|nr:hydroxyacylglutathione hydrolase [Lysobacter defluvii]KGO97639.1 hydroxyacylglutathione hydrolase [Lysobacter defluvii IMMIB APB-9 = DSM 18482]